MKRNHMAALLTAALLTTGGLMAYGGGPGNGCSQKNGQGMGMMQQRGMENPREGMMMQSIMALDLSDTQRESIEKLMVEKRYKMRDLRQNRSPMSAFSEALSEKGLDTATYIKQAMQNREAAIKVRAEYMAKMVDILTPKQRVELKKQLESMPKGPGRGFMKN